MTREEAKELLPIIQAFAEGKVIEYCNNGNWVEQENFGFMDNVWNYRIKSKSKYRPFKNAEECWQEMQKHQPFGWVKINEEYTNITKLDCKDSSFFAKGLWYQIYRDNVSKNNITFVDGTPFGVKVE